VRVRPDHGAHAAVEEPAEPDLLACRLGVHVDEHVVDVAVEVGEHRLDLDERGAPGAQVQVARQVDHPEAYALVLHDAPSAAGLGAQVVGRAHDALLLVEVVVDLPPVVGVVAQRDRVDAGAEQLVGDLRGDAEAAGHVLAVDDDERRAVALAQPRQQREQRPATEPADEVADEEDGRGGVGHGAYSRARGR